MWACEASKHIIIINAFIFCSVIKLCTFHLNVISLKCKSVNMNSWGKGQREWGKGTYRGHALHAQHRNILLNPAGSTLISVQSIQTIPFGRAVILRTPCWLINRSRLTVCWIRSDLQTLETSGFHGIPRSLFSPGSNWRGADKRKDQYEVLDIWASHKAQLWHLQLIQSCPACPFILLFHFMLGAGRTSCGRAENCREWAAGYYFPGTSAIFLFVFC